MTRTIIIFLLSTFQLHSQAVLSDYYMQWIGGYDNYPDYGYGLNVIDFNNGSVSVDVYDTDVNLWIDDAGSVITDTMGQIAAVTNGCYIMDRQLSIIEGGDTLNGDDYYYRNYCERGLRYPSIQSSYFIPRKDGYRLIHSDINRELIGPPVTAKVYCTDVQDQRVMSKKILLDSIYTGGRFFLKPLGLEGDFILIVIPYHTNIFETYKMENDSFSLLQKNTVGPEINTFTEGDFSQVAFSSAGDMIAINNDKYGLMLYNFDIDSGVISNHRSYSYSTTSVISGLCFSPSDQYVYVTNGEHIYQIDIMTSPEDPLIHDYGNQYIPAPDGWPIGIGAMLTGPDCRIYVAPRSTTNYMHVIHNPDEQGEGAGLEKQIELPMKVYHDFPNVPNLFATCDSTIAWEITSAIDELSISVDTELHIYPNPTASSITIELDMSSAGTIRVYDVMGALVYDYTKEKGVHSIDIDMSDCETGTYHVMYHTVGGIVQSRVVKM